jgi:hypothetical protein
VVDANLTGVVAVVDTLGVLHVDGRVVAFTRSLGSDQKHNASNKLCKHFYGKKA